MSLSSCPKKGAAPSSTPRSSSRRAALLGGLALFVGCTLSTLLRRRPRKGRRVVPLSRAALYRKHDLAG